MASHRRCSPFKFKGSSRSQPRTESPLAACTPAAPSPSPASLLSQQQSQPGPENRGDDELASSAGPAEGSLNDIVERLLKLVDEENTERSEPHLNHEASSIRLSELFDFGVEYWMGMAEMTGCRGLQDELEFYEPLDLDGSGIRLTRFQAE